MSINIDELVMLLLVGDVSDIDSSFFLLEDEVEAEKSCGDFLSQVEDVVEQH